VSIARFHVFSGTGNGRFIAEKIASGLESRGFATEVIEVCASRIEALRLVRGGGHAEGALGDLKVAREPGDLDVFVFPVYAMAVPRLMNRYMRALGKAKGRGSAARPGTAKPRAAILSANGRISDKVRDGHEGQALAQAQRILSRGGWDVEYRETFDYPHNITNAFSAADDGRRDSIVSLMEGRIEKVVADLAEGRRYLRPCRLWAHVVGWPFGWLYRIFGRRCFGMLFAADERCDGCGACAARCPAKAITMRGGRPAWSYACEGCERCINLCHKNSIQTSLLRLAVIVVICSTLDACPLKPLVLTLLAFLPGWASGLVWTVLSIIIGFVLMRLIDIILVELARIGFMRPILGFGWTRWTRRYKAPVSPRR
jgi:Dissimilatory sulfite reductase (desulfoviridin), alpha and beta subunits